MPDGIQAGPIKGVKEAIKVLVHLSDDLAEDLPREARSISAAVASDVAAAFPGVIAFIQTTPTGRVSLVEMPVRATASASDEQTPVGSVKGEGQVPLFRVIVTGENAVFADVGNARVNAESPRRVQAVRYLDRSAGSPSRFAWPVAVRATSRVSALLERSAKRFASNYTDALAKPDR